MFRFTIRELLVVVALVGTLLGWGLDHWRLEGERTHAVDLAEMAVERFTVMHYLHEHGEFPAGFLESGFVCYGESSAPQVELPVDAEAKLERLASGEHAP
jgi:hypothetical protein